MYAKLIFRNAKRSAKDYLIYIVTLTICVTLFYAFLSISSSYYQPDIGTAYEITAFSDGIKLAVCAITLVYLANHPSWVFSAGQIYEEVWGEDGENCGTAVASVIGQIRRKLTPDMPKAGYIRTVLGSGYKFEVPQGMAE